MQVLYEVTVAALMTLGDRQIGDRIVIECSIRHAERTMMTPRVGFGQRTSGLAGVDARVVVVPVLVVVTAQGSGH